ncbi:MAG: efflux transporter, family, subunit [Bacteroidetes bacterium]|nr:efflux transporter, family, subunit [Bacteroidota bacterium]
MRIKNLISGLLPVLLLVSCGKKQEAAVKVPVYETLVTSKQNAELQYAYPVTIKGSEDVEIRPRLEGFIKDIYVDEGSAVKKGQLLFTIDAPNTEKDLRTAEAAILSAKAQVSTAKLNVDRIRPLAEKNIVSGVQLSTAENSYQTALAGLDQAKATLANARASRSWANVTSPVDGVVGTIAFRKGSFVSSAYVITTVANVGNVYAYFSLNEKDLNTFLKNLQGATQTEKLKNTPPIKLILADGTEYPESGKIQTISGVVNVTTGSANFRVEFPNKAGLLRSGSSGKIIIPEQLKDVVVIPQTSTFARQDKTLVYKVQGDSVVQSVISVVGLPDGQNYAVTEGLTEGVRIVKSGVSLLTNGAKITVK